MVIKIIVIQARNFPELRELVKQKYPNISDINILNRDCIKTFSYGMKSLSGFLYSYKIKIMLQEKLLKCESGISSRCKKFIYGKACYYHGKRVCSHCFDYLSFKDKKNKTLQKTSICSS